MSSTLTLKLRHGKEPIISDVQNKTFTDTFFDGGELIKDTTFASLQDQSWSFGSKNSSSLTTQTKNGRFGAARFGRSRFGEGTWINATKN